MTAATIITGTQLKPPVPSASPDAVVVGLWSGGFGCRRAGRIAGGISRLRAVRIGKIPAEPADR